VTALLEAIGTCEGEIDERYLDVVTAVSGSGPAYMYLVLDAIAEGAVKMGINRNLALRLAAYTMKGASSMVISELESNGKQIMQMKDEVCSPGGTTIHGVTELENNAVRSAFIKCIEAAANRSKELNQQ
jgi:pyrroline-5-carboxylate reductase